MVDVIYASGSWPLIPLDTALTFFIAACILGISPGPDNIFVLTQATLYGSRAGLATTLGLCTGIGGHTLAVALGVAALFQASPHAFWALKLMGAAYLLFLAWGTFKHARTYTNLEKAPYLGAKALYLRGIIMNITNPKVTIFFLALLPQFVHTPSGHVPWQIAQLGGLFMLATVLVFGGVALCGGRLATWMQRAPQWQIYIHRVAGGVFVALACALLFT